MRNTFTDVTAPVRRDEVSVSTVHEQKPSFHQNATTSTRLAWASALCGPCCSFTMPPSKKARTDVVQPISDGVEIRSSAKKGNGLFAQRNLAKGWIFQDHPVCVPCAFEKSPTGRQLPRLDCVDDLMQAIVEGAEAGMQEFVDLLQGPYRMTYLARHLEMQDEAVELPDWATLLGVPAAKYNLLAAQLQSNVARGATSEGGDGFILNPRIRLANHACDGNVELAYSPDSDPAAGGRPGCSCGLGNYLLRATRPIPEGTELCFSYIGDHVLAGAADRDERRELLHRRWGFWCECNRCVAQAPGDTSSREANSANDYLVEARPAVAEAAAEAAPGPLPSNAPVPSAASTHSARLRRRTAVGPEATAPRAHPVHGLDTGLLPED